MEIKCLLKSCNGKNKEMVQAIMNELQVVLVSCVYWSFLVICDNAKGSVKISCYKCHFQLDLKIKKAFDQQGQR